MKNNKFVCELTAISFYLASSLFSVCSAATMQNESSYYNMLLDDDSSVALRNSRIAENTSSNVGQYFTSKNTIQDVLDCKEFTGFANLLVPDTDKKDLNVHLNEFQRIMPYHRNVTATHTIESLDYLYDEVKKGNQVYYPIYTPEHIKEKEELKDAGLFFFRGKKKAPFALILPGGYSYKSLIHEGFPLALRISKAGYNAFVLSYRQKKVLSGSQDLVNAVNYIMNNFRMFGVSKDDYSLWGASTGAQIIINVTHTSEQTISAGIMMSKPAVNIYTYPISFYGTNEDSPTFIVVGENDTIVNKTVLKSSVANLNNLNINAKYTEMPRLEHGFGIGIDPEAAGSINWISRAIAFWEENKEEF